MNVFCTFADRMRKVAYKICAVVLLVWYCLSIVGFDIHTCRASQRSFVTTFVTGTTCKDIHPEYHCPCAHHSSEEDYDCCGHQSSGESLTSSSCCTDDFKVLPLTGFIPASEDDSSSFLQGEFVPFHDMYMESCHDLLSDSQFHLIKRMPDSGLIRPGDVQSVLGIWRI